MCSAIELAEKIVACFDVDAGDIISNLKLQKLLYYAHGWSLAIHNRAAFDDVVSAWQWGPVVESAYHHFKPFGKSAVLLERAPEVARDPLLDALVEVYGERSTVHLMELTHEETPWKRHYREGLRGITIPDDEIKRFFEEEAPKDPLHHRFLDAWVRNEYQVQGVADEVVEGLDIACADREAMEQRLGLR